MPETSFDTLALAGAMVSALFAGLCILFARQRDATPVLTWWAAALAAEAVRLGLISMSAGLPDAYGNLVGKGGHVVFALLVLGGTLRFVGEQPWTRTLLAGAGLCAAAIAAGPLYSAVTTPVVIALIAISATALGAAAWLFGHRFWVERRPAYLMVLFAFGLAIADLLGDVELSARVDTQALAGDEEGQWWTLAHLGLWLFTVMSLVFLNQQREHQMRLEASQRVAASEQRFRDFAQSASDWFWETDMDQRFTYCSSTGPLDELLCGGSTKRGGLGILGRTRQELWKGLAEPDPSGEIAEYMARQEIFRDLEFSYLDPERGRVHVRLSGKPVFEERGRAVAYRGSGRDVTVEVAAQAARVRTAKLLEAVFENMAEGISVADSNLNMAAFNNRFLDLLDFPPELFQIGDPFEKFIRHNAERGEYGPGDPDQQVRERVELAKRFEPHHLERTRPDGTVIEIRGNPVPGGGFVTTYTDITERKHAEEALRESREMLRAVVDAVPAMVNAKDLDSRYVFINRYQADVYGVSPEAAVGKTAKQLVDPKHGAYTQELDQTVIETGRQLPYYEEELEFKHGERRVWLTTKVPLRGDGGQVRNVVSVSLEITERKRVERALRQSEASLANAQRIARLGNWDWNVVTNELTWSDETYRIFGLEPHEFGVIHEGFLELVHQDDRALVQKALVKALAGAPYSLDHRIVLPDGRARIVHEQGEVEFDRDGKPIFMRGTVQDVTVQRRAIAAVRENEQHIRAIVENVADGLVTINDQGIIESVNPAVEQLFGYSAVELIGENVSILMPQPHHRQHDSHIQRYLATGEAGIIGIGAREVTGARKDGSPIDVDLMVSEMQRGGTRLFIGVVRDITERKQAEEALRQKTAFVELSKAAAAAANEALNVEDALQTCVTEVCSHVGWPVGHVYLLAEDGTDELVPSAIWHLDDPRKFEAFRRVTMGTRFPAGAGLPGRVLAERKAIWIEDVTRDSNFPRARMAEDIGVKAAFALPVLVGTEIAAVLQFFSEDAIEPNEAVLEVMAHVGKQIGRVIERARSERQLLATMEAAEYANRTKGEFLATMSHELRTPLNAIIGFSEVMTREMFGPMGHSNYKEYAADIRNSGTHLLNIINDILDVSKAEAGMIELTEEQVDLADVIESSLRLVRPRADEKNLLLESDLPEHPVTVRVDQRRLKQVMLNLLSNAIKFTATGRVTIKLRGDRENGVVVQVIDTGIGISERDLERVMEPFTQVASTFSRTHEGTGLGLPLSRALIELHGGELTIESAFGSGTVATVRLPAECLCGSASAA